MEYITDTDFLPAEREVSADVYRLLYGVVCLRWEARIYDTIVILCRRYPDIALRRAKINAWKLAISDVTNKLSRYQGGEYQVYIPYLRLLTTPTNLLNLYNFTYGALSEVYALDSIQYRRGTSKETVQEYYPVPGVIELMRSFAAECKESGEYGTEIEAVIEQELSNRGLIESSSPAPSKTYQEIFFKGEIAQKLVVKGEVEKEEEGVKTPDLLIKTGFLYYALKEYFEEVYRFRSEKEYVVGKLLDKATWRIASGLFKPNEPVKGNTKNMASNTFYRYVIDKKFDDRGTKKTGANSKEIKKLIEEFL